MPDHLGPNDMLPIHSGDVHHRNPAHSIGGATATVGRLFSHAKPGSRQNSCQIAVQVVVVICVLLPLLYLFSDQGGSSSSGKGWGSRKDLKDVPSYPAAHLRNLVLVAGHAVYTGLDFSLATKESSWFLEEYQKVPGAQRPATESSNPSLSPADAQGCTV